MIQHSFTKLLFVGLGLFLGLLIFPFFSVLLVSFCFVSLVYPLYELIQKKIKHHNYISSTLTVFLVFLFCIVPFILLFSFGLSHLSHTLQGMLSDLEQDELSQSFSFLINAIHYYTQEFFSLSLEKAEIKNYLLTHMENFLKVLYSSSPLAVITSLKALFQAFLFLLSSIVLLAESRNLIQYLEPHFKRHKRKVVFLLEDARQSIKSTFYSGIIGGFAQATLIVIGVLICSFSNLLILIPLIYLICLLPVVGAFVCYTVASVYLFSIGSMKAAVIFMVYGLSVVSITDNIIRAFFIKGKNKVHPFLLFLALIGGAKIFGAIGILIAPIVLFLFLSTQKMYFEEKKIS